jgi:hypothetical protein
LSHLDRRITVIGELRISSRSSPLTCARLTCFRIHKDKISGYSIRLPGISAMQMPTLPSMSIMGLGGSTSTSEKSKSNSGGGSREDQSGEEIWTRACRGVLAVLKRILMVESEVERSIGGSLHRDSAPAS